MRNKSGRRKSVMWISNNKVLIGGGMKKPHARNPNFETEETKLLISLWGDPKVQKTLITTHKKHPVIAKLAEKMREHGYHRSPEEINTRIKNLKCFYNRIKKDLDTGVTNEPTWRHYTAMDEILTRPVFGNRVQQPHLQNNNTFKFTAEDADGKELRPEDLLSVEGDFDDTDVDFDDGSIIPKEEPIDIDEMDEVNAEDIADANDNDMDDVNDIFPKLSAYLQLASNSALKGAPKVNKTPPLLDIKQSPPSSPSDVTAKMLLTSALSATNASSTTTPTITAVSTSSFTTVAASSSNTTTNTNKISLVPTNILMKPNANQGNSVGGNVGGTTQFSFKPQQFLCAKSTAGTATSSGMPMKVLLVNTLQKAPSTSTSGGLVTVSSSGTISTHSISSPLTTRPLVSIQPKTTNQIIQNTYRTRSTTAATTANVQVAKPPAVFSTNKYLCSNSAPPPTDTNNIKRPLTFKPKASPGFRTLLNQLVQMQSKQLEVSRQRLDVERERLAFERTTADRLINALSSLVSARNGSCNENGGNANAATVNTTANVDSNAASSSSNNNSSPNGTGTGARTTNGDDKIEIDEVDEDDDDDDNNDKTKDGNSIADESK